MKKRRQRGILIPVAEYKDDGPPVHHSDQNWSYVEGYKGHYSKIRKKTCYLCSKPVDFIAIFYRPGYRKKERFCKEHAESDGPLPLLVPVPVPEIKSKSKSKNI